MDLGFAVMDKGLIVVTLCFSEYGGFDYYLVFDSVDRSLSLIPYIPKWASSYTKSPLPLRHDGGYSLVLFGDESGFGREGETHFLWQWSPSLAGSSGGRSSNPWQSKKLCLPAEMKGWFFTPDVLFSSNGFAFWTDLALGTLYCDCSALLRGGNVVNFTFIELPPGYQLDRDSWPVWAYRTMGCVGGSLKFVSIDKPDCCCNGRGSSVKVWTMAPWSSRRGWKLCSDFRLKNLWKDFKRARLPKYLPMWPMLREQEGSSLYLILDEDTQTGDGGKTHYICQLDMPTKSLLQSKLLDGRSIQGPVILPSDFFERLDSLPCTSEQNLDGRLTKRPHIGQGC